MSEEMDAKWRQQIQAEKVRDTGNGPTVPHEEEYLRAKYGEPDENGVYGAPEPEATE